MSECVKNTCKKKIQKNVILHITIFSDIIPEGVHRGEIRFLVLEASRAPSLGNSGALIIICGPWFRNVKYLFICCVLIGWLESRNPVAIATIHFAIATTLVNNCFLSTGLAKINRQSVGLDFFFRNLFFYELECTDGGGRGVKHLKI